MGSFGAEHLAQGGMQSRIPQMAGGTKENKSIQVKIEGGEEIEEMPSHNAPKKRMEGRRVEGHHCPSKMVNWSAEYIPSRNQ